MYRISKGDIRIEADTDAELAHAVKVLTDQNVPIPSTFGVPLGPVPLGPMAEHLIKHPDDPGVTDVH